MVYKFTQFHGDPPRISRFYGQSRNKFYKITSVISEIKHVQTDVHLTIVTFELRKDCINITQRTYINYLYVLHTFLYIAVQKSLYYSLL